MKQSQPESDLSDEQLAERIARRGQSEAAWREAQDACRQLYERHARLLLAFLAARVGGSDVEDLHQTVWQRTWQSAPDGFHGGNFRAWLYQIARNAVIDQTRKKRPEPLGEKELPDRGSGDPLAEEERAAVLGRCLEKLGEEMAGLVRARLAGESYEAICDRLGLRPERAHKLFHQAKEQLRTCVQRALE